MRNVSKYLLRPIAILGGAVLVALLLTAVVCGIFKVFSSIFFNPTHTIISPSISPSDTASPNSLSPIYSTLEEVPDVPIMRVRYGGSTSFASLTFLLKAQILKAHSGFELVYAEPPMGQDPGTKAGIRMLLRGEINFALASRSLEKEELEEARARGIRLEPHAVAIDGIAFYINPSLSIDGLTADQIKGIYTGSITNWRDVGGPDREIIPYSRNPETSGTVKFFQEEVLDGENFAQSVRVDAGRDTTAYIRLVAEDPGGIGYASAPEVCNQKRIHPLPISAEAQNFIAPCNGEHVNQTDIANASYRLTRPLFVIIKRDGSSDERAGVAYLNLLLSDKGQQIVKESGLVPIR